MAAFAYRFNKDDVIVSGTYSYNIINQIVQQVENIHTGVRHIMPAYTISRVGRPDDSFVITEQLLGNAQLAPAGAARGGKSRGGKSRRRKSRMRKNNRSNRKHV